MSKLSKRLAALSIVLFFSLGVLSASFAGRIPFTSGLPKYVKFHRPLKYKLAQMDRKALKTGVLIEADGEPPDMSKDLSGEGKPQQAALQHSGVISTARAVFAPKVSTLIFQSVLNL